MVIIIHILIHILRLLLLLLFVVVVVVIILFLPVMVAAAAAAADSDAILATSSPCRMSPLQHAGHMRGPPPASMNMPSVCLTGLPAMTSLMSATVSVALLLVIARAATRDASYPKLLVLNLICGGAGDSMMGESLVVPQPPSRAPAPPARSSSPPPSNRPHVPF